MSSIVGDGWPETIGNDRQMTDIDNEIAPQGKQWQCCTTCQGKGKVLVDVEIPAPTAISVSLSAAGSDGLKGSFFHILGINCDSPPEERRKGNNPFGPRGTLRCLACQRRKKRVII